MRVWYVRRAGAQRAAGAGAPSGATCDVSKCDGRERSERPEQEHRQVRLATFRSATGGSGVRLAEGQEHRQVRLATVGTAGGRVYRVIRRLLSVKRPVRWTVVAIASGGRGQGRRHAPSHLSVLKLATLALRTLRVLDLRSSGTSHSPSAPPPIAISDGNPCTGVGSTVDVRASLDT